MVVLNSCGDGGGWVLKRIVYKLGRSSLAYSSPCLASWGRLKWAAVMNSIKINDHQMGKFNFDTVLKFHPFAAIDGRAGGWWVQRHRAHRFRAPRHQLIQPLLPFHFITDQFDIAIWRWNSDGGGGNFNIYDTNWVLLSLTREWLGAKGCLYIPRVEIHYGKHKMLHLRFTSWIWYINKSIGF